MKKILMLVSLMIIASTSACVRKPYACSDPMGCVKVGNATSIKIATLLTMSGPNSAYGNDAVRGVEIACSRRLSEPRPCEV